MRNTFIFLGLVLLCFASTGEAKHGRSGSTRPAMVYGLSDYLGTQYKLDEMAEQKIRESGATDEEIAMINAVRERRRGPIGAGYNAALCKIARKYAQEQANNGGQNAHGGYDARFNEAVRTVSGIRGLAEITAQTDEVFNRNSETTIEMHAAECVRKWRGSSGHDSEVNGKDNRTFCYTMVKMNYVSMGRGQPYVCVGLFGK